MAKSTRLIGPLSVISYPHLDVAQASQQAGKAAKFSCAFIFTPELLADPKEKALFKALQDAAVAAVKEKWGDKAEALLKSEGFKKGFRRDWEAKGYPEGSIFITARSTQQPGIVYSHSDPETIGEGKKPKPAKMPQDKIKAEMYPGVIGRPLLTVFTFDQEGNKGVSFGLEGIQKVREGTRIDGRVAAEDSFDVDLSIAPASLDDLI
jgi:hypothetical protein